jgi:branched-subunit amino acid aminotransferase/4-amino-4-deoxychorismate lyase
MSPKLNITCQQKRLSLVEFYTADEVFTTGTMGELTPVIDIDGREIGNSCNSEESFEIKYPIFTRINEAYRILTMTEGVIIP